MNKNESKYFNTAIKMDEAFLELLEKKDFPYITVKEICEKAKVNRSTFYLHYETLEDLLSESVEYMNEQFLAHMKHDTENFITQLDDCSLDELYLVEPKYLMPYLEYIKKNKRLFFTAITKAQTLRLDDSYNKMFRHVFTPILNRYKVPVENRRYIMAFYIQGIMAIITEWLKNDCKDTTEHIMTVIGHCVRKPQVKEKRIRSIMKAGIYLGKEKVEIRELPIPAVGENDVLIQNIYSSICGTDVAVFTHGPNTGHKVTVGGEFGHETISRVVKIGKNIKDFTVGERVYPYPRYAKDDTKRAGTIGGFSEYILIPNARKKHSLYPVDSRIPDKLASLIEPFTVGCRAARRGMISCGEKNYVKGQNAVVFGCGTIGIAAAVAFKYFGMEKVMVCDYSDFRLELAKNLGFAICNPSAENFREKAKDFFGIAPSLDGETADIDCWLDAAGAENILDDFLRLGKIESRFVSVAVNNKPRSIDLLHMTYAQQSIIGSGGYMPEDVRDVQEIMASGKWNLESIITHEFPLEQLETAIRTAGDVNHSGNVVVKM